ncbi:MAG: TonB-dependent receptor [Bacteroidota bacterium]
MYRELFFAAVFLFAAFQPKGLAQESGSTKTLPISEVTVNAFRTNSDLGKIPQQLKIISQDEINTIPANGLDDLLKKSASIDLVQYIGFKSTIGMRGFTPSAHGNTYTLVLINGIPVGTDNISTLNLNSIKQVEILKGPYSSFFGSDAMGGVINISRKKSKDNISGKAAISYGSFNSYKINANVGGKISPKFNFDFYVNTRAQGDNYITGNNNLLKLSDEEKLIMEYKSYGKEYENTQYSQYNIGGRLGFQLNDDWALDLNQDYWLAKDIQTNGTFWGSYGAIGVDIDRWSQNLNIEGTVGNNELRFSPHYSIENTIYYNDVSSDKFQTSDYSLKSFGFIMQDALIIGTHRLIFGLDNFSKKYESKQWLDVENPTSPFQPDYLNMTTGIYLQANINLLNNKLNTSIGGRYDNINFQLFETELIESVNSTERYNVFNPNLGIQYKFFTGFKVHAAAGRAFVAPDAFKVAGNYTTSGFYGATYRGNPNLKPETSVTYDLGLAYNNKKTGVNIDVTYFTTYFKDQVVTDGSNADYITFINADKANMDGLEVAISYDLGALKNYAYSLKAYLDYTHMYNASVIIESPTEISESQMKYVRMNKASFGVMFTGSKGFSARINARYIGPRDEDNWFYTYDWTTYERIPYLTEDGQEIRPELIHEDLLTFPDHLIVDLSASYTIKEKYGIGITVDNLFDDNYMEKDLYYMMGRSFMARLSYKF